MTRREVSYRWRPREVMTEHGMFSTTYLGPLPQDRGIDLSVSQVHRLVTGTPEPLSLQVLAALCDIYRHQPRRPQAKVFTRLDILEGYSRS